jgi:hypothetical protein
MAGFARESWLALASGGGLLVAVLFDEMLFDQVGCWLLAVAASSKLPVPKSVTSPQKCHYTLSTSNSTCNSHNRPITLSDERST